MEIGIQIEERFQPYVEQDWLRRVVEESLSAQGVESELELGLLITDDETIHELNRKYRGVDKPTDVLTFALLEPQPSNDSPAFVMPPDGILHLGEVVISYNQAAKQAEENGHPISWEIALLIIHGILHLLGYEHDEPAGERQMRDLEENILVKLGSSKNVISSLLS